MGGGGAGVGQAAGAGAQGGGSAGYDHHTLLQKLQQLVAENRLQAFYPPQRLAQLAQVVGSRDVAGLGARWKLPREVRRCPWPSSLAWSVQVPGTQAPPAACRSHWIWWAWHCTTSSSMLVRAPAEPSSLPSCHQCPSMWLFADDSGSMAFEEGGERIDDMKAVLGRTADAATLFDTDGIVVRWGSAAWASWRRWGAC